MRVVDVLVVCWVIAWAVVGLLAAREIRSLQTLSQTMVKSSTALDQAGRAIEVLGAIPLVGEGPKQLGLQVRDTAASVGDSGRTSRTNIRNLSVLLAIAIVGIPITPVLFTYAPLRLRRARELKAIRQSLATPRGDPGLQEFLARRAVQHLPYYVLRAVSDRPWHDLEHGHYRPLAEAELRWLGLPPGALARHTPA
ncbi:MAG TPA: hypothetical protein VFA46_21590 [Actinomycetes bacterium]|jgi:hypothetical protein|nr:hypothetical protein [Actinomycetes bacterium]